MTNLITGMGGKKIDKDLDAQLEAIFAEAEVDLDWDDLLDLTKKHEDDKEPDTEKVIMEFVKCPECKGSGQYVGLGVFPPDKCHTCDGDGRVLKD